ncbi:hypothetical protein H1P_130039 [Hyella patelloides LEGE 07179]|uniref:Uncharacterized protein n=1 Tax=Hyella patelloides LEGE 07179 TaxID=945734 RepID=A0A563VKP7_9CYAN|nr:hypothetical protein H1P_130039 [Hyella patelloides LEGE 07179]
MHTSTLKTLKQIATSKEQLATNLIITYFISKITNAKCYYIINIKS